MERIKARTALYPGCSLDGTEGSFRESLEKALAVLGIEFNILNNWNCCGATSAHALDHTLYLSLALRNLVLAESQGYNEILALCAACYHRLASANFELGNSINLLKKINNKTGLDYRNTVNVRNILDFLANVIGSDKISKSVVKPLDGLKVACYYGCLNTRIPRMKSFDNIEYPTSMDLIVEALGAEALDWSYKTDCCGASLFITAEPSAARLASKILKEAVAKGADCIAVACPMCHNNLDTKQKDIIEQFDIIKSIPVLFISQLIGLAFGISTSDLKLDHNFIPFNALVNIGHD